jgi:alpha-glucosidase
MPEAIYDYDGQPRSDAEARNLYALLEARTSYEAQRELRPDTRPWVFSRSGFAGLHRYGANWGGDAETSFASLRANVEMSISMGLSGQPFFGHDIGGFLGSPSAELFMRWMSFSAYTPLFRNHAMNTSERREPWAFGEPYLSMARTIINERYRLIPYFYSLFHHDASSGQPVLSPLPFHFPADSTATAVSDQFMVGKSLLVAPILEEGSTHRWVYLPQGASWIHERTGTWVAGGNWVPVQAAVDQIPVFVRDGSIIPRAPVAQSTAEQPLNRRSLDVYCGEPAAFDLYEDDGISFEYEGGRSLLSHLTCTPGSTTTLSITRGAGTWTPPADRQWRIALHRTASAPSEVRHGTVVLPQAESELALETIAQGWFYAANQQVVIKVPDQSAPIVITVQP